MYVYIVYILCMYKYVYIYIYVCMYIYMYIYIYVCMYIYIYVCMYVLYIYVLWICTYIYIYTYTHSILRALHRHFVPPIFPCQITNPLTPINSNEIAAGHRSVAAARCTRSTGQEARTRSLEYNLGV